jgi:hypothetical protein
MPAMDIRLNSAMNISEQPQDSLSKKRQAFHSDLSVWSLIVSNLVVIIWALVEGWSLPVIMWVYWIQSVSIGFFWFIKIMALKDFSTKNLETTGVVDKATKPTKGVKVRAGLFFLFHYNFFHLIFALFLISEMKSRLTLPIISAGGIFFFNQLFSFLYNRKELNKKKQNIGKVFEFPYIRIIPMHLTIFLGSILQDKAGIPIEGKSILLLFLLLKTIADVGMYVRYKKGFGDKPSRELDNSGPLTQLLTGKTRARKYAKKIHDQMKRTYAKNHKYQVVNAKDFPNLDLGYYTRTTEKLKANGFTILSDIEDATLSQVHPQLRTFIRCLVNETGTIGAGIYHVNPKGYLKILRLLRIIQSVKAIELETEFSNGCFLCTSNVKHAMTEPPQIMVKYLPTKTSATDLLKIHKKRIEEYLSHNPKIDTISIHSMEDAIESQNRQNAIKAAYRSSIPGMLLEKEMNKIVPEPELREKGEDIVYEMQELQDSEENRPSDSDNQCPLLSSLYHQKNKKGWKNNCVLDISFHNFKQLWLSTTVVGIQGVSKVISWVLKVLCSLGSNLFSTGPCGVSISKVPSSLSS